MSQGVDTRLCLPKTAWPPTLINNFGGDLKPLRYKYEVPFELKTHFIRGYFDGDGSLSKSKKAISGQWEVGVSGHTEILTSILNDIGLNTNITNDKSVKRFRIRKKDDIRKFLEYIYRDIKYTNDLPLYIKRKYEKAVEFLSA